MIAGAEAWSQGRLSTFPVRVRFPVGPIKTPDVAAGRTAKGGYPLKTSLTQRTREANTTSYDVRTLLHRPRDALRSIDPPWRSSAPMRPMCRRAWRCTALGCRERRRRRGTGQLSSRYTLPSCPQTSARKSDPGGRWIWPSRLAPPARRSGAKCYRGTSAASDSYVAVAAVVVYRRWQTAGSCPLEPRKPIDKLVIYP